MEAAAGARARALGMLAVCGSGACYGLIGVLARAATTSGASTVTLLFLRFALAGGVLCGAVVLTREPWPRGRALLTLMLLGGVGYVGESLAYFRALEHAAPGLVALLLYLFPALVAGLAVVVDRERLSRTRVLALCAALLGSALTIGPAGGGSARGVVLGLVSAFIYAGYVFISGRVMKQVNPLPAAAVITSSAACVYGVLALGEGVQLPAGVAGWSSVVTMALVSTVAALVLLLAGMRQVGAVVASMLSTMEPLVAVLTGALFLGERLSATQLLGGALILGAVVALARAGASGED
ncbi:MAG: DMT family transporter [Myxococcaceae bacterium]|nr:DMT family transporter [Myxococcaceae bacterium]MCI0669312.1 DMT family transporter [Myxococcaceae bacterium]